jgi:hypothetical protein
MVGQPRQLALSNGPAMTHQWIRPRLAPRSLLPSTPRAAVVCPSHGNSLTRHAQFLHFCNFHCRRDSILISAIRDRGTHRRLIIMHFNHNFLHLLQVKKTPVLVLGLPCNLGRADNHGESPTTTHLNLVICTDRCRHDGQMDRMVKVHEIAVCHRPMPFL